MMLASSSFNSRRYCTSLRPAGRYGENINMNKLVALLAVLSCMTVQSVLIQQEKMKDQVLDELMGIYRSKLNGIRTYLKIDSAKVSAYQEMSDCDFEGKKEPECTADPSATWEFDAQPDAFAEEGYVKLGFALFGKPVYLEYKDKDETFGLWKTVSLVSGEGKTAYGGGEYSFLKRMFKNTNMQEFCCKTDLYSYSK
eukprot:4040781-Lingulodinium_polyedra.AAC.1